MVSRNLTSPWSGQATTDSLPPIKVLACHSGAALARHRLEISIQKENEAPQAWATTRLKVWSIGIVDSSLFA
jgi:hypothetical protein